MGQGPGVVIFYLFAYPFWPLVDHAFSIALGCWVIIIIKRRSGINPIPPTVIDRD